MQRPKKLLIATDLSARSDRALERAAMLAREAQSHLAVLHVIDTDLPSTIADRHKDAAEAVIREHLASLVGSAQLGSSTLVQFGKDYEDILRVAEEVDADLIILGTHRENPLRDIFRGTTAERVIRLGIRPCLVVRDRVRGPYRRVLVGVDFSAHARRAIEFALRIVPRGEIYLVHAYDVPFKGFIYGHDTRRELGKRHEEQFKRMVEDELPNFLAGLEGTRPALNRIIKEGSPRGVLHQQIEHLKPDLLVVGTHGRTGVAHALLGSVAEDMLSNPPCDVLAVKAW